jgi:hypothetical protein
MQPRTGGVASFCNARPWRRAVRARGSASERRGTPDALVPRMKDIVFVVVTIAFFAVGWLYAQSFDRL